MLMIGVFAVAVGVVCFVLLAAVSMRDVQRRRRRLSDGGAIIPLSDGDDDGFGDG